jgi:membrane-bound lytic murein transglycosylase D
MAKSPVRLAASGVVCALLVAASAARAGDPPHPAKKHETTKVTKPARGPSEAGPRRSIAGGPTSDDVALGAESPELRTLREAERELFPPAAPAIGSSWPSELPMVLPDGAGPRVHATGVPPADATAPEPPEATGKDLAWLSKLETPDIPVRWDERVVRYLEFFRDDPRGHRTYENLYRHSGRYREMMRRTLRRKSLPEDLVWVSMIESGFDPTARSAAAAAGLWQFTADTAKIYGLAIDRWLDQRLDPEQATEAAADLLGDLHRRFGTWELALAAYDMGYGGLSSVVHRYNTNDFWSLTRTEGTLPWETTLYVPKIIAAAVVAHNLTAFGFGDVVIDPPVDTEQVNVPPGTQLSQVAQAAGCTLKDMQLLNPELRASRTPPLSEGETAYPVRVPRGKGDTAAQALSKLRGSQPPLDRYVVRFGETLDQIAALHKTTTQKLVELNAIAPGEAVRGGTVLLVPHVDATAASAVAITTASLGAGGATGAVGAAGAMGGKPTVVVPSDVFVYPDRKRVFYRVQVGDTLEQIATALHVSVEDLDRWNDIEPAARLQEGMTLQAFVPQDVDLSKVLVVPEGQVQVLPVSSDEFFAALEKDKNFKRITVTAHAGDTIQTIGRRYSVSPTTMERINRRGRGETLREGEAVVVYVPNNLAATGTAATATAANGPTPNGPLPLPPLPDLLP